MSQMPDIDSLLETDEKNVREMQKLFAGYQGLPELLNTASVLYTTCSRALWQALSHEVNGLPRDTSPDSPIAAEVDVKWLQGLLFSRIGTLYASAVTDLLRARRTAPLGYIRLQCESIGLIKLMSEHSSIAQQWVNIQTDKDGQDFYKKHHKRVMAILSTYNLSDTYNQASGSALHSRFIGLARGYKSTRHQDGLLVIEHHRMNVQEFDPDKPYS